jgi:peptide/nickel transport system substrate-binding protein
MPLSATKKRRKEMKKAATLFTMFMVIAIALSACSTPAAPQEKTSTVPAVPAADEQKPTKEVTTEEKEAMPSKDDLNISINMALSSISPFGTVSIQDLQVHNQVFEGFYFVDDTAQPHPRLAEKYEVSEDGKVYTFHMRKDAYFHNGDNVKASDAVFSYKTAKEAPVVKSYLAPMVGVEAVDDYTVKITLNAPYVPFINNTASIRIVSEREVTEQGEDYGTKLTTSGTGPYKIVEYNPDQAIVLEAFDKYYRGVAPIKKVTFFPITDTSSGLIAFESGELDFYTIPLSNWAEIENSGKFNTALNPTSHISYVAVNLNKPQLKDVRVREAIAYAIDKEAVNLAAYEGLAEIADHMFNPKYITGASKDAMSYSYDPEKSKALLAEAGLPDGFDAGSITTISGLYYEKIAQVIQANLAEVGISATINAVEQATATKIQRAGDFDIACTGFNAVFDYDFFRRSVHSNMLETAFIKFKNSEDVDWARIDKYFDDGSAELDPVARDQIYLDLDNYLMETATFLPMFYKTNSYAWDKDLNVVLGLNYNYVYDWSWN